MKHHLIRFPPKSDYIQTPGDAGKNGSKDIFNINLQETHYSEINGKTGEFSAYEKGNKRFFRTLKIDSNLGEVSNSKTHLILRMFNNNLVCRSGFESIFLEDRINTLKVENLIGDLSEELNLFSAYKGGIKKNYIRELDNFKFQIGGYVTFPSFLIDDNIIINVVTSDNSNILCSKIVTPLSISRFSELSNNGMFKVYFETPPLDSLNFSDDNIFLVKIDFGENMLMFMNYEITISLCGN